VKSLVNRRQFAVCGLQFAVRSLQFAVCSLRFAVRGLLLTLWRSIPQSSNLPILLLLLLPIKVSSDCTPGRYGYRGYSFLNPNLIDVRVPSAPLFVDIQAIYEYFGGQQEAQRRDNVIEWRERYCNTAEEEDIRFLIYNTEIRDLEQLRTEINMGNRRLSYPFTDNSFARYINRYECTETVDYLIYAKRCEPYVTIPENPWNVEQRDTFAMRRLAEDGLQQFKQTESHYIKLRYAYQIIRLMHYAGQYGRVLSLYDFLMPQIDFDPSIIEYWIMGHHAGALMGLGRNVQASYLYSRVFENCPSKAESASRSFNIKTDEEWRQCELLCQSDRERATLYALRANISDSKALEEMQKIYELDPDNHHLEILLMAEVRKLEKDFLGTSFNDNRQRNRRLGFPRAQAGQYLIDMQNFIRSILKEDQIERPLLWKISLGYLEALAGNYYDARRTFEEAREQLTPDDALLAEQLNVFALAMRISTFTAATDSIERMANRIRKTDLYAKYPDFQDFLKDKMTALYEEGNSPGKAFLSTYTLNDLRVNPQIDIIEDLLLICDKPNRNSLETALITKPNGSTIKKDLLNIKATLLLGQFRLEESLAVLKEMDRNEWDDYGVFNPFISRFKDCINCALPDTANTYNKGELMERMQALESLARGGSERAAEYYFDLGTAYYNITYFGYAWQAADLFRSGSSMRPSNFADGDNVVPHPLWELGNREVVDCTRALFFFEKARQLANETNPELAARATYMAAKCERNAWYISRVRGTQRTYDFFDLLRENYPDTRYYGQVVRECKTFQAYLARQ